MLSSLHLHSYAHPTARYQFKKVSVYVVDLQDARWSLDLLSIEEKMRTERFVTEELKRRFTTTRAALRKLLGWNLNQDPRAIEFAYNSYGKPYLKGLPLYFNVSHSHEKAVIAVSQDFPVGVDLERVCPIRPEMEKSVFSKKEQGIIRSHEEPFRTEAFFRGWTQKEAILKALGTGISSSLDGVSVWIVQDAFHTRFSTGHFSVCTSTLYGEYSLSIALWI